MHVPQRVTRLKKKKKKKKITNTDFFFFALECCCLLNIRIIENKGVSIKIKCFDPSRALVPLALRRVRNCLLDQNEARREDVRLCSQLEAAAQQPGFAVWLSVLRGFPGDLLQHQRENMPLALHSVQVWSSCLVVAMRNMETSSWS